MSKPSTSANDDLKERASWGGTSQARAIKYRRLIGLSKRSSIFLGTRFPKTFPLLFVLGYPKSGTSWMCQLLADYLRLPFPQHSLFPLGCEAVLHSFEAPSKKYKRGVYMVRDGRDTVVSAYFHTRGKMLAGSSSTYFCRLFAGLDLDAEPRKNMAVFLERLILHPSGGWTKLPNWGDHVRACYRLPSQPLVLVRFEDLLSDGPRTLSRVIEQLTGCEPEPTRIEESIARFAFTAQSGRKQGDEDRNSYLRKGQAGDWVNHFSPEACQIFEEHFGEILALTGYEANSEWVDRAH